MEHLAIDTEKSEAWIHVDTLAEWLCAYCGLWNLTCSSINLPYHLVRESFSHRAQFERALQLSIGNFKARGPELIGLTRRIIDQVHATRLTYTANLVSPRGETNSTATRPAG